jgi:hypothetical protein
MNWWTTTSSVTRAATTSIQNLFRPRLPARRRPSRPVEIGPPMRGARRSAALNTSLRAAGHPKPPPPKAATSSCAHSDPRTLWPRGRLAPLPTAPRRANIGAASSRKSDAAAPIAASRAHPQRLHAVLKTAVQLLGVPEELQRPGRGLSRVSYRQPVSLLLCRCSPHGQLAYTFRTLPWLISRGPATPLRHLYAACRHVSGRLHQTLLLDFVLGYHGPLAFGRSASK